MNDRPLGPRQQEWLDKIRAAGFAFWMTGLHPYAFLPRTHERIPQRIVFSLEDRGLIRRVRGFGTNTWTLQLVEDDDE